MLLKFKNYTIREATNDDSKLVKQVIFTTLMEYGLIPQEHGKDQCLSDLENNYFMRKGYFLVALDDKGQLVGTIGLYYLNDETVELRKMYILKTHRGNGLGKFMLEEARKIALKLNYKKMVLETISPLVVAIGLYKKFGFIEVIPAIINDRVDQAFEYDLCRL